LRRARRLARYRAGAGAVGRLVHRHGARGNLIGSCVATIVVAAWEGDLDRAKATQVLDGEELGKSRRDSYSAASRGLRPLSA
jgi:hypothetical protein